MTILPLTTFGVLNSLTPVSLQVTNNAEQDELPYATAPQTAFQKFIRLKRQGELSIFQQMIYIISSFVLLIMSRFSPYTECNNVRTDLFYFLLLLLFSDVFGYRDTKKNNDSSKSILYDHRPLQLNQDDYERVCLIPRVKVEEFR